MTTKHVYDQYIHYAILFIAMILISMAGGTTHAGKSGHGLTNFLTLYISFEHKHYQTILLILQSCMRPDY